jgi:superfamily II DNA or RNA helicase
MKPKTVNGVTYHRITISGDFTAVPCRVKRRQAETRKMNKNVLRVGFTVESIGEGDYYGFEIDGNRRFLLGDFTVTHNTITFGTVTKDAINKGYQVLILAHRKELIVQAADKVGSITGVDPSIIKVGYKPDLRSPLQVASVQSLVRRLHLPLNPKLIICDETHHCTASTYLKIFNHFQSSYLLGVTATPTRLNGQGFEDIFDSLVVGPKVKDLISEGYLSKFKLYADPTPMITKGCKTQGGDYNTKDVANANDAITLSGNIVKSYQKYCPGKKAIVFAINVQHSIQIAKRCNEAGIPAAHLDGTTPEHIRQETVDAFSRGELLVLSNVGLFDEGFDLPALDAVQIAKPTKSLTLWLQMVGRVLRTSPDKDYAIILDHTLNFAIHGLPTREREWTLQGVEQVQEPIKICKETGEVVPNPGKELTGIEEIDIHLIEVEEDEEVKHTEWLVVFDKIINFQQECGYDNYWLLKKLEKLRPPMAVWQNYAELVGYKRGWAFYKSRDQGRVNKPPADIERSLLLEPPKRKGTPITLPLDSRTA